MVGAGAGMPASLVQPQRAGNKAMADLLAGRSAAPAAVQRHIVKDEVHADPATKHRHETSLGEPIMALVKEYDTEVASLLEHGVDGEAAERLTTIWKVLHSWSRVLPVGRQEKGRATIIAGLMGKAQLAADQWRKENEELDRQAGEEFEDPALKSLVLLEGHAADAGREAERAVKAGTTAGSAKDVEEPAAAAAEARSAAEQEQMGLAELAHLAGGSKTVKAKTDAYMRSATRAVYLARRMAGIAEEVLTAWKVADDRRREAVEAIDKASRTVADLEEDVQRGRNVVDDLIGYAKELAVDLALMSQRPYYVEGGLNAVLLSVQDELARARLGLDHTEQALLDGREDLQKVTENETRAAEGAGDKAGTASSLRSEDVTAGIGEAEGLTELRLLAGSVEAAERLLVSVLDQPRLIGLLKALGRNKTEVWLQAKDVGPQLAQSALDAFGIDGLRDLVKDVADIQLRQLLNVLTPARLAELVEGLTGKRIDRLAAAFSPKEIDDYATQLTAPTLSELIDHVRATELKEIGLPASELKLLLPEVPSATLGELVRELGAPRTNKVLLAFPATKLKALLVDLPASALAVLDATPARIKALLTQFAPKELAQFGLTDTQFKAVTVAVDPTRLKDLALALGYAPVKGLVVAYPKGTDLSAFLIDLPSTAVLKDLFTEFTGTEIRDFRTTVGTPRFKWLLFDQRLPAAALSKYGAGMLKGFIGAGNLAWTHLTTASISNTTQQISGAHDEDKFKKFIGGEPASAPGDKNAELIPPLATPAAVYTVKYRTHTSLGGKVGWKTLIQGLAANPGVWKPLLNEAVWDSIRTLQFPAGAGKFTGADTTTRAYEGYYHTGLQVDTVYPL